MNRLDSRYGPNEAEVAAEVIDGEAILINLSSGVYYSLDKAGGLAWELIAAGHSLAEAAAAVAGRYAVPPAQAEADVLRLAEDLLREGLVRPAPAAAPPASAASEVAEKLPYESLALTIYRDMGDLLALDPPMPALDDIPWKGATSETAEQET
jgi:hypothetical protein